MVWIWIRGRVTGCERRGRVGRTRRRDAKDGCGIGSGVYLLHVADGRRGAGVESNADRGSRACGYEHDAAACGGSCGGVSVVWAGAGSGVVTTLESEDFISGGEGTGGGNGVYDEAWRRRGSLGDGYVRPRAAAHCVCDRGAGDGCDAAGNFVEGGREGYDGGGGGVSLHGAIRGGR